MSVDWTMRATAAETELAIAREHDAEQQIRLQQCEARIAELERDNAQLRKRLGDWSKTRASIEQTG